jgi:hypothetical protein
MTTGSPSPTPAETVETRLHVLFYAVFVPVGAAANLALGLVVLTLMRAENQFAWLELGTGAVCCMIAGWLAATAWSRYYWRRTMARQVAVWGTINTAFFSWVEDAPVPADAVHNLKSTLEKITATAPQP